MAGRLSFHAQLSAIMETMARSALVQVCKLVDEDSSELQLELSRLLVANSALAERVNSLQCELTVVRSDDAPKLCKSYRSVGVQTSRGRDADAAGPPTIEGIFGKDWCMDLWKDRGPYSVERFTDSPSASPHESTVTFSDHITVTEIKEEDFMGDAASSCLQEPLQQHTECEAGVGEEQEQLSAGYSLDGSACSLTFDQDGEPPAPAGDIEEVSLQLVSIGDAEEAFSTHIIPIEEEDEDDDDVQFVQESQQEATPNPDVGLGHDDQRALPAENTESSSRPEEDPHGDFDAHSLRGTSQTNSRKFTCQICSRTFFHKGTLTHHMKSHKSNFCNICKQHFPHRTKLNSHSCVPPVASQKFAKACELCGKIFANPSALRIHYVVHTGEKPYACSLCGKGFTQKGNLKCHLRIHTGERPFRCGKCGKTFTQKVNLNHHLMAHRNREFVGSRPFARRLARSVTDKSSQ